MNPAVDDKIVVPLEPYVMLWSIPQNVLEGNVEVTGLHVIHSETVRYRRGIH